ncbi:MAG: hypothetical protein GF411_13970 [Candidatus Lokiarchaeota archaeon]|nr:hypothetical protein [Candidatus Lokiarchaeota archaeon]
MQTNVIVSYVAAEDGKARWGYIDDNTLQCLNKYVESNDADKEFKGNISCTVYVHDGRFGTAKIKDLTVIKPFASINADDPIYKINDPEVIDADNNVGQ